MTSSSPRDDFARALTELMREPGLYMLMIQTRIPVPAPLMRWGHAVVLLLSADLRAAQIIASALRDHSFAGGSHRSRGAAAGHIEPDGLDEQLQRASVVVANAFAHIAAQTGEFTRQTLFAVDRARVAPALVCCQVKADSEGTWAGIVDILGTAALASHGSAQPPAHPAATIDHNFSRFMTRVLDQQKGAAD